MHDSLKKILIDTISALVIALAVCWSIGAFSAETAADVLRLLSDGFFVSAAIMLAGAGLTWTYNGGVMDGLSFSVKTIFARMTRDYESKRQTFAEFREKREAKASSPVPMLVAGLIMLFFALGFYSTYCLFV